MDFPVIPINRNMNIPYEKFFRLGNYEDNPIYQNINDHVEEDFNNGGDLRGGYSYSPEEISKVVNFSIYFLNSFKKRYLNYQFENQDEAFSVVTTPLPRNVYSILPTGNPEIHSSGNGTCYIWGIFGSIFIKVILGFIFKKKNID